MYWIESKRKKKEHTEREEQKQEQFVVLNQGVPDFAGFSGVEQDENKVFFYSGVGDKEVLELNKIMKRLDKEMQVLGITLNIDPPPIELHVHSEGGSLFAGIAAYDCIRACKSPVHTYIDGCAASAATLLFLAGDKKIVYKNSHMLIHQLSSTILGGKFEEFKDELKNQEKLMYAIKNIYLENSSLSEEEINEIMKRDLWMDSEMIIKNGFATEVK